MTRGWAPGCRFLFTKKPLIIGLFREKRLVEIRHHMGLCHPVGNESGHMWMSDVCEWDSLICVTCILVTCILVLKSWHICVTVTHRTIWMNHVTCGWVTWHVAWRFHVMMQCTCNYYLCHAYICVYMYTYIYTIYMYIYVYNYIYIHMFEYFCSPRPWEWVVSHICMSHVTCDVIFPRADTVHVQLLPLSCIYV